MAGDVVGRASVQIDTDLDTGDVAQAGQDLERILGSSAETAVAQVNQSFSQLNIDAELTNAGNVFAEGLDAAAGSAREFGGGFGDLVTAFDTFGISATDAGATAVRVFEQIEAGSQLFGGLSDIIVSSTAAFRALSQSTRVASAAQAALNVVLNANPIGLVVVALAALVAGLVIAYNRSETFRAVVQRAFQAVRSVVVGAVTAVRAIVTSVFGFLAGAIRGYVNGYLAVVRGAWTGISAIVRAVTSTIRSVVTSVFGAVRSVTSSTWSAVRSAVSGATSSVRSAVSSAFSAVRSVVSSVGSFVRSTIPAAFRSAVSGATAAVTSLLSTVRSIPGRILGALAGLGSLLVSAGRSVIEGLARGIRDAIGSVIAAVGDAASAVTDFWPFSPAKRGPLSGDGDPARIGERVARMLAAGIQAGTPDVARSSGQLAGAAAGGLAVDLAGAGAGGASVVFARGAIVVGPGTDPSAVGGAVAGSVQQVLDERDRRLRRRLRTRTTAVLQ